MSGLIALLIRRVRQAPDDMQAWIYLGRGLYGARAMRAMPPRPMPARWRSPIAPAIPMRLWIRSMAKPWCLHRAAR